MSNQLPQMQDRQAIVQQLAIQYQQPVIRQTTSQMKDITQVNIFDQSIPIAKQEVIYNPRNSQEASVDQFLTKSLLCPEAGFKKNKSATEQREIKDQKQDKTAMEQEEQQVENIQVNNNLSTTPDHFTVSKVYKLNQLEQNYESVRSNNFPLKQIFYQPVEIELPGNNILQTCKSQQNGLIQIQSTIIPCTLVQLSKSSSKQACSSPNQPPQPRPPQQAAQTSRISRITTSEQKAKIITDALLQKINQLEQKVKILEQQKKKNEEIIKTTTEYQSTPHIQPNFGSIKRNQMAKKFSTVTDTQTQDTHNNGFRVRSVVSRNLAEYKIHSNIYSMTLIQGKNDNGIKQELDLLKKKLQSLQNAQNFNDSSIKNKIKDQNFKIFQNKPEERFYSPSRKQLGGKIVRRSNSKLPQSPENSFRTRTEESIIQNDDGKGFIRSGPQKLFPPGQESKVVQSSMFSNINQSQEVRKRVDSSAIFRKNPGPAITNKKFQSQNTSKFQTLQFNPDRQKIIVLDSKQTQQRIDNLRTYTSSFQSEIQIPVLNPYPLPDSTSQQLIEIGKLTFRKLGCDITENTILNVKKFKNCVLFSIGFGQNILWHYEGRFYYGGWKMHANGEGEKQGKGLQFVPGKYRYKGMFEDGKRAGYGKMVGENGAVYSGHWYEGVKEGKGKLTEPDGTEYEGDWKSGKKSGYGKLYYKGKLQFEGNFVAGLKNGYGKQYFENGDYYEGEYLNNKFEGTGTYHWASKAVYSGQFKDGKRHGHGVWRSAQNNYDSYEGQYLEDNKNGYGVYRWANGAVYKGSFRNDFKHGEGTITYENGKVSHMVWNNGNVQRALSSSQFFQETSQKNHTVSAPKSKLKKASSGTRSNHNLQSAKSLKSERSLPKGINIKKQQIQSSPKASPKVQFRTKFNNSELLKAKINLDPQNRFKQSGPFIKDPPYRGMQTTSNVNLNL